MKKIGLITGAIMAVFLAHAQPQQAPQEEISSTDYRFAISASKAGILQLKLSELALVNGASSEIKALGEKMVSDYTAVNKELKAFADQRGIYFFPGLDEKQQKYYLKLSAKKGEEFDLAYARFMIKNHKDAIGDFEKEIRKGLDADLKNWASAMLPSLEQQQLASEATYENLTKDKSITFNY